MHKIRLSSLSKCVVFFDFDNTITPFDVLDKIIQRFSVDAQWQEFERAWKKGRIGSGACLEGQLRSVRVTRNALLRYVSGIKIDPYFHKIFGLLRREGLKPIILSDSFGVIIKSILENNGLEGLKIYANDLRFYKDRPIPRFPFANSRCRRCAHCKKKNLLKKGVRDKIIMYVGDGFSDICPAQYSDMVFAKGRLLDYFRKKKRLCVGFGGLEDIYNYFRSLENGPKNKN